MASRIKESLQARTGESLLAICHAWKSARMGRSMWGCGLPLVQVTKLGL